MKLTSDYLDTLKRHANRFMGQWTGTSGSLAAGIIHLLQERKDMESTITQLEQQNQALRDAVASRLAGGTETLTVTADDTTTITSDWILQGEAELKRQRHLGDGILAATPDMGTLDVPEDAGEPETPRVVTHPTSLRYYQLCDRLKAMHAAKSRDYGCPSGNDPLANIRNGAAFVGIEPWKGAMVRLSDKVTRLATFNATGKLGHEGVVDTCLDLASYALLALLLYEEETKRV